MAAGAARADGIKPPSDPAGVTLRWGVKVPLRDGIHLNATVYLPADRSAPKPCVFTLTPYVSDSYHEQGMYFAAHGLPFAVVDVRGRGNSEGTFRPLINEANDGYDVVEWLARQDYCNGKIATWGGSYSGYVQWAAAKEFPPHLSTIVPAAAPYLGVDFPMRSNIFYPYLAQWIIYTTGPTSQANIFGDQAYWSKVFREWHQSGQPFRALDTMIGIPSAVIQEWLTHPEPDAYWDSYNPRPDQYARIEIPVLTITASHDDDQPGALEQYRQHRRYASPDARARHFLIIGPWDHAGTRAPKADVGGLQFGPASLVDLPRLHLQWYAWTMANGPRPDFLKKAVAYYVMGAEKWRYADSLEAATARHETLFLDSSANANDVFSSGSLGALPGQGQPDSYRYDPRDTHGLEVEAEASTTGGSLVDQTVTLALSGKALVYHSRPFEADTEVSGFFRLSAWISIDCPDTDLYVSVYEIRLDGSAMRLSTDAIRARYREGPRTPKLIRTSAPLLYDFDRFTFISRQIKRGSRLRLVIAPMGRLVETTFAEKNYNAGGVVADESVKDARAVTVKLFHDRTHRSVLHVPLGQPDGSNEALPPRRQ